MDDKIERVRIEKLLNHMNSGEYRVLNKADVTEDMLEDVKRRKPSHFWIHKIMRKHRSVEKEIMQ